MAVAIAAAAFYLVRETPTRAHAQNLRITDRESMARAGQV
jgi:hypothetical protein